MCSVFVSCTFILTMLYWLPYKLGTVYMHIVYFFLKGNPLIKPWKETNILVKYHRQTNMLKLPLFKFQPSIFLFWRFYERIEFQKKVHNVHVNGAQFTYCTHRKRFGKFHLILVPQIFYIHIVYFFLIVNPLIKPWKETNILVKYHRQKNMLKLPLFKFQPSIFLFWRFYERIEF